MKPFDRFRLACNELGWGDARNGLWFFGMEEAFQWGKGKEAEVEKHFNHKGYFRDRQIELETRPERNTYVPARADRIEAKISSPLSRSGRSEQTILDAITRIELNTSIAHANLYPLGKPRANSHFPDWYLDLFGYGASKVEMNRYKTDVQQIRFPRIQQARERLTPQAIVCFGKSCWPEFRFIFGLSDSNATDLQLFYNEKIILAPHWSHGHLKKHINRITEVLKSWKVTVT